MEQSAEGLRAVVTAALHALWPGLEVDDDKDRATFEDFAVAAYTRLEEIERRMGWVDIGAGRKRFDPSVPATAEEQAASAARWKDMVESGKAPMTPAWNPRSVCQTTGCSPEMAEHFFPTKAHWDSYLKATGKIETGGSELKSGQSGIARPKPPEHLTEDGARDLIARGLAALEQAGQVKNGATGEVEAGTLEAYQALLKAQANGKNGTHAPAPVPDPTLRGEIAGDGGLEYDPAADVENVPVDQRTPVDTGDFESRLGDVLIGKGRSRMRDYEAGARPSKDSGWARKPFTG